MALACLTVLMSQAIPTDAGGTGNWATGSLFGYAACTWGQHLRACSPNPVLEDMAMKYLEDNEKLNLGILTAYTLQPEDMAFGFDAGEGLAAAHVCSIFGLTNLLQRLPTAELYREASSTGRIPLAYASRMGYVDTVDFLLNPHAASSSESAGALRVKAGMASALRLASIHGRDKVVQLLLFRGADVNAKDSAAKVSGETSLISAARMGHTDIVRLLLEHGADVNAKDSGDDGPRETPLISASRRGHADIVRLLLEHGANPNSESAGRLVDLGDAHGRTSLAYACRMGHVDTVKLLLDHGADPVLDYGAQFNDTHDVGFTVLHEAIKSRQLPVVEALLRSPVVKLTPIILGESETVSFLMSLLQLGSLDILTLALARDDLDVNEKDHNGRTAVWWLLSSSRDKYDPEFQVDAMRLIVQHPKCDINAVDLGGRTYVMRLLDVRILNVKLLSLLLENGADVNHVDEDGETAIFHAVTIRYSLEITSLLILHGADLTIKNRWGQSLTHRLVADMEDSQDLQYLDLLLERKPELIGTQDERGRTPLHLALVFGKTDIAKELLARAADDKVLDKFGRAPFDVACQYGRTALLPQLAPVGLYLVESDPTAEEIVIAPRVHRSAPERHRQRISRRHGPQSVRSDAELHATAQQVSTEISDPLDWKQIYSVNPLDEVYDLDPPLDPLFPIHEGETPSFDPNPSDEGMTWNDEEHSAPEFRTFDYQSIQPTEGFNDDSVPEFGALTYQPLQAMDIFNDETFGQEADSSHTTGTNTLNPDEAMLELQLDKLPAWSLGYLGRLDKLLEKLQNRDTDPLERCPDDGNTALHTVIKSTPTPAPNMSRLPPLRHSVFYDLLARVKQDCSPQNGCEETPLHTATLASQIEMALMLIEAGANLSLRDNLERTPLDLAKELEQDEVVASIEDALNNGTVEEHREGLEGIVKKPIPPVVHPLRSSRRIQKHGLTLERRRLA
ncbi:hypothetical protein E4T52_10092 [Aureobasidium sp. EXF-3400]|nr:hypothetical protein E4T51_09103 [Aureobasidium sp. EXF-12344]KAI4774957.1 hypothetical protein E4T52_10092 [Aureobasidium sp. EXF-3400]